MENIFTTSALFVIALLATHMIKLEIKDRRENRRWKANLRKIQNNSSYLDDLGNNSNLRN